MLSKRIVASVLAVMLTVTSFIQTKRKVKGNFLIMIDNIIK